MGRHLCSALKVWGYTVFCLEKDVLPNDNFNNDVIMEIEIREFWLTADWKTHQNIIVQITLIDPKDNHVLLNRLVRGEYSKFIGIWNIKEFEDVIQHGVENFFDNLVNFFIPQVPYSK